MAIETWVKTDGNGRIIEQGRAEKLLDSITLKKDSKGNIVWEIKVYGANIKEALDRALLTMAELETKLNEVEK